jgi:glycosyltransferase involved in cell wall biosynthesis
LKTVSVIIPDYNNAYYLESAIQSVLRQTFADYEIIVVDDGSTDNSKDVVSGFGEKVRYIWQENKGLGGARNTGILASNAEFVALLDADDEWQPTYLEKMILLAKNRPTAAVYYSGAQGMDMEGNNLPQIFGRMVSSDGIYPSLLRANFIIPSTVTLRRAVVVEAGLFAEADRKLHGCEDWDLWLRLSPSHSFAGTAESLVRYRIHGQSLSANFDGMSVSKKNVVIKHFGLDDGRCEIWSSPKKLAYAGLYRYSLVSSIQRRGDWQTGGNYLRKALLIDPAKALDVDLFYELALGSQPVGYRGSFEHVSLETNAEAIMKLLDEVFQEGQTDLRALKRATYGTACYAIGLFAYNTGNLALSRNYLWRAGWYSPQLWVSSRLSGLWVKSLLGGGLLNQLRRLR